MSGRVLASRPFNPSLACVAAGPRTRLNHLYILRYRRFRVSATQATLASHAGVFRGARLSFVGRDGIPAPLKTPAWEANSTLDFRRSLGCGVGLFAGGGSQTAITCDQTVLLPLPLSFFPLRLGEEKVRTPDPREQRKSIQGLTRKGLVQNRGCVIMVFFHQCETGGGWGGDWQGKNDPDVRRLAKG